MESFESTKPRLSLVAYPSRLGRVWRYLRHRFVVVILLLKLLEGRVTPERNSGCVVTGIDESHAQEAHGMILSASKVVPAWKTYVYDLGLHFKTVQYLQQIAEVLPAPISMPEWALQFERGTTSFKPWILEDFSRKIECPLVMYADSSIRYMTSFGEFVLSKHAVLDVNLYNIHAAQRLWTHPQMYQWFSRSPSNCTLRQYQGGSILFRPDSTLWKQVLALWRKCAQFKRCMLPDGAQIKKQNPNGSSHLAHRDDQSALNFALVLAVGDDAFKNFDTLKKHIKVKWGHLVPFEVQQ